MKIAIVGGGSTYSPELVDGLARRADALGLTEVALSDLDARRLEVVGGFVARMVRRLAPGVTVTLAPGLDACVAGARFVVTQIRVGGNDARRSDERLGASLGVLGQETTGVGGFSKAMRTIPALLEICAAMERHAPDALLVNFTNPVSIVTQAILNHSKVSAIGLCNIPIGLRMDLAKLLDVTPSSIRLDSVGLNHLSFVRGVIVDGKDVLPALLSRVTGPREHRPANLPELDYPEEFVAALGMIPSDYLRYFFLQRESLAQQAEKKLTRAEEVMKIERELLDHYADPSNDTKPDSLSKRGGAYYSHAAIEVIEAVCGDTGAELVVDVLNHGAVKELHDAASVEVPCTVGAKGATPLPQRALEPEIRGLIQHVKAYEDLTVQAALEKSRRHAILALASHPLVPSVSVATRAVDALAGELGLA